MLGMQSPHGIQGNSGMTAFAGKIYVANRQMGVGVLDMETMTSTRYRGPQNVEAEVVRRRTHVDKRDLR